MVAKLIYFVQQKKYILIISALFVLMSGLLLNPVPPLDDYDSAYYLMLATSLSSHQGYRDIFYPSSPLSFHYPFLYPLMLSFVLLFFPHTIIGLKIVSVMFGLASILVLFILLKKCVKTKFMYLIIFFVVINFWFLSFSAVMETEISYLFFSLISILFLEKYKRQENCLNIYLFASVLFCGAAFFTRTIGFSIVLGVFIYFWLEKEYKKAFLIIGLWFGLILPWIIWKVNNNVTGGEIISGSYLSEALSRYNFDIKRMVRWVLNNISDYWKATAQLLIPGYFLSEPDFEGRKFVIFRYIFVDRKEYFNSMLFPLFTKGIVAFFSVLTLSGFIFSFKRRNLISFYILTYCIVLVFFPAFSSRVRYFVPLLPFILYYFFFALSWEKIPRGVFKCVLLILLFYNLLPAMKLIRVNIGYFLNTRGLSVVEKKEYYELGHCIATDWVKKHTRTDAVIMCHCPAAFYLLSRRKAVFFDIFRCSWPRERSFRKIRLEIKEKKVDYIVVGKKNQEGIIKWLNKNCENIIFQPLVKFKLTDKEDLVRVYKVVSVHSRIKLLNREGLSFYNKGNFRQAIFSFQKTLKIKPIFMNFYNLGQIYEKKGLKKEAEKMYRKAIDLQPNYKIARDRFNIIGQEEMVKQNPDDALAWEKLGNYYLENYDYFRAINAFKKALELNCRLFLSHYNLGKAYLCNPEKQQYVEAVIEFKKALKLNSGLKEKVNHYIRVAKKRQEKDIYDVLYNGEF